MSFIVHEPECGLEDEAFVIFEDERASVLLARRDKAELFHERHDSIRNVRIVVPAFVTVLVTVNKHRAKASQLRAGDYLPA